MESRSWMGWIGDMVGWLISGAMTLLIIVGVLGLIVTMTDANTKRKAIDGIATLQADLADDALAAVEAQLPSWKTKAWRDQLAARRGMIGSLPALDQSKTYSQLLAEMRGDVEYYVRWKLAEQREPNSQADVESLFRQRSPNFFILCKFVHEMDEKKMEIGKASMPAMDAHTYFVSFRERVSAMREPAQK